MLVDLRVKNFAIVEDGNFTFTQALSVFSGETGAGKSLLLDAITLLLGVRGGAEMVRSGSDAAEVEGVFDLSRFPEQLSRLETVGFPAEEDSALLVVRRQLSSKDKSKNRIWIQGKSATRAQLQEVLGDLVEISGQHEFLRLGREDYLLNVIDQFVGDSKMLEQYSQSYSGYRETEKAAVELRKISVDREDRLGFLKFQIEEFEKAGVNAQLLLQENDLLAQRNRLGNIEKIQKAAEVAHVSLAGSDESGVVGVCELLAKTLHEIRSFRDCGKDFADLLERTENLAALANDLKSDFGRYSDSLELNPEALEAAESRISALNRLKRKHTKTSDELLSLLQVWTDEVERLENFDLDLDKLEKKLRDQEIELKKHADALHQLRSRFAEKLAKVWQKDLAQLGMKDAQLSLQVEKLEEYRPAGVTRVSALFSANLGEDPKPLTKIASGGELSRIMLSLKSIVSGRPEVGVYLFDEVDAGIGGATAHLVAERLKALSAEHQVLVVTHLGSIAAAASSHWSVQKISKSGKTKTVVSPLFGEERISEIARMLGGDSDSPEARRLAEKLIQKYSSIPLAKSQRRSSQEAEA
jgi:DNA repair protein RecN (Recombination protein N)